jgi:hypothetical protein
VLIQKLKNYKNVDVTIYHQLLNSIGLFMSVIGYSKIFSFELFPMMFENLSSFHQQYRKVIESRIASSSEQKKILSLSHDEVYLTLISAKCLIKLFSFSNVTFIDMVPQLTDLITLLIGILKYWNDYREVMDINALVVHFYQLLEAALLFTSNVNGQSPFINICISLLRNGISSGIQSISSVCKVTLNIIETNLHPRSAPLYIPHAETVEKYSLKRKHDEDDSQFEKKRKLKQESEESEDTDEEEIKKFNERKNKKKIPEPEPEPEPEEVEEEKERVGEEPEEEEEEEEKEEAEEAEEEQFIPLPEVESEDEDYVPTSSNLNETEDFESDHEEEEEIKEIPKLNKQNLSKFNNKPKKKIEMDLESIDSDDPEDERDISDLQLKF